MINIRGNKQKPVSMKVDPEFFNQFNLIGSKLSTNLKINKLGQQGISKYIARSGVLNNLLFVRNGNKKIRKKR